MTTVKEIINKLELFANPEKLDGMARFAIVGDKRMGVSMPHMRKIAKDVGKNHQLALELWKTRIPECQIIAALIGEPDKLSENQMDEWVKDFNSWDVCDQVCMNLFDKSPFAIKKINEWADKDEEFVKRAAYATIACIVWHNKDASNESIMDFFPIIMKGANDERNFVKKSVSWALRHIGKRNLLLNKSAIKLAIEIKKLDTRPARWIASDVIRELESEAVQNRLRK